MVAPSDIETLRRLIDGCDYDAAHALLIRRPLLAPESEADLHMLSACLSEGKALFLLETLAERFLEASPNSVHGRDLLANALHQAGRVDQARALFLQILTIDPTYSRALCMLGLLEHGRGDHAVAIEWYKRTIEVDPKNYTAIENLRDLLERFDRLAEFDAYKDNMIDWDSALFQERRAEFLSRNALIRVAAEQVLRDGLVVLRDIVSEHLVADLARLFQAYRESVQSRLGDKITLGLGPFLDMVQAARTDEPFLNPYLAEILTEIFGSLPAIDYQKSVFRLVTAENPDSFVPFHQDMRAFGLMGINLWLPLTPAGGDFPGLELLPGRTKRLLDTLPHSGEYSLVEINRRRFNFDEALLVAPVLKPGDCILFLGDVVHRTYIPPSRKGERISLEIRLFA